MSVLNSTKTTRFALIAIVGLSITLLARQSAAMPSSPGDYGKIADALALLKKSDLSNAYRLLDSVPAESAQYPIAFLEMQKIHYRESAWDKFFGFAAYYHTHLKTSYPDADLLVLESLALTKHCQFHPAEQVAAQAKSLVLAHANVPDAEEQLARVQAVEDLLYLQSKMPGNVQTIGKSAKPKVFTTNLSWNIHDDRKEKVVSSAVKNPRALRVFVKNLCEGGGAQ